MLISWAREIENDAFHGHFMGISRANYQISRAFHGLLFEFHDVFTGFSSKQTQTEQLTYSGKPGLVRHWPETYYTRAVLLGLLLLVIGYEGLGGRNENRVLSVIVPYF